MLRWDEGAWDGVDGLGVVSGLEVISRPGLGVASCTGLDAALLRHEFRGDLLLFHGTWQSVLLCRRTKGDLLGCRGLGFDFLYGARRGLLLHPGAWCGFLLCHHWLGRGLLFRYGFGALLLYYGAWCGFLLRHGTWHCISLCHRLRSSFLLPYRTGGGLLHRAWCGLLLRRGLRRALLLYYRAWYVLLRRRLGFDFSLYYGTGSALLLLLRRGTEGGIRAEKRPH